MAKDWNYNSVSLLLHLNGADASTTFTDSSPSPKTATSVGSPAISETQSKFGGSSLYVDAANRISFPDDAGFTFGSGDFTVEGWFYFTTLGTWQELFAKDAGTPGYAPANIIKDSNNKLYIKGKIDGGSDFSSAVSSTAVSANTWYHIALVRYGDVYTVYRDGVSASVGCTITQAGTIESNAGPFIIGSRGNGWQPFIGYVDDFRVTKGVARYTAAFTPLTAEYPDTGSSPIEIVTARPRVVKSSNRPFHHIGK